VLYLWSAKMKGCFQAKTPRPGTTSLRSFHARARQSRLSPVFLYTGARGVALEILVAWVNAWREPVAVGDFLAEFGEQSSLLGIEY
jgi:hypothetical protein